MAFMREEDLERLYARLEKPLCNVVFRWVWNMDDAQDVVQDAFVRLWRMRDRIDPATLVVALVTWAGVGWRGQQDTLPAEFDLVRMHLGLLDVPSEPLTIPAEQRIHTAVRRVPLATDQVVFYRVGSIQD